jgi:hypothetical protein
VAVLAPEAATKAATTTPDGDLVYFSFPVDKTEETPDGDVIVYGKATDGTLDSDLQIVDPDWSAKALREWFNTGGNVRVQHQAQRDPAGRGLNVEITPDGHFVKALIVEPVAKELVRKGVLRDWSVGIMHPDIRIGDPRFKHLDPEHKAVNGVITGRADGLSGFGELSLVDRGSNFGTRFQMVKAAADGTAEWVGKVSAPDDVLAKVAAPKARKSVTVELPANMSLSVKPSDLAKLATFKQTLATAPPAAKVAEVTSLAADVAAAFAEPEPVTVPDAVKAAETAVYKRDIDTATRTRLASAGHALSDGSYPIENAEDLGNAATLARSGHGNVKAAKKLISRRARELGVANPLKGKTARSAVRKALAPDVTKKKGKLKAICPGCGAKQNPKHVHCPECGAALPASATLVAKNHEFVCLGCGATLDKGEPHCPQCGKENPGYLPEADHQIPANKIAKMTGKGRVAKAAKPKPKGKGKKKGGAFGDSKAPPFGAKPDDSDGDGDAKPDAKPGGKKPKGAAKAAAPVTKKKKGKGGSKPTPASAGGVASQEKPAPPHREPDGAEIENFERQADMEDGDSEQPTKLEARTLKGADPEAAASLALKALGVPPHLGALHALTCPVYDPETVAKAFPHASFAAIDTGAWQSDMLGKTASAPMSVAIAAMDVWKQATTLQRADPYLLADLRAQAHKAFRDANPGPGSFPEPAEIGPQRFNRPYISAGHGAPSPEHDGPHHAQLPEVGGISAQDHTRPYISAGHADQSPENHGGSSPMPAPATTGLPTSMPVQQYHTASATESTRHALEIMHDHIAHQFPDLCSMSSAAGIAAHPVPVPHGVPAAKPAPGARKAAKKAKAKLRKQAKAMVAKRRKLERRVLKGALTVDAARRKLGLQPFTPPEAMPFASSSVAEAATAAAAEDAAMVKAAVAEATAPLTAALNKARKAQVRQDRVLKRQGRTLDAIAASPDTSASPMRGVTLHKQASAAPVAPLTVSASAEQAQITKMRLLHDTWRSSPDPQQREAAYAEYTRLLGVAPMTPT